MSKAWNYMIKKDITVRNYENSKQQKKDNQELEQYRRERLADERSGEIPVDVFMMQGDAPRVSWGYKGGSYD